MMLNLPPFEVKEAGVSQRGNQKWTGKVIHTVDGQEMCVLITVVPHKRRESSSPGRTYTEAEVQAMLASLGKK